jgi:hypothetical protein
MSFNLPPIPAAKRPGTTLNKARIRNDIKTGSFNPAILISLQTRQEPLSCFDMLAKNTGGWGADFIGEQSKYSVILNGVSSSAGIPACVLFGAGHAQERSSPSNLSNPAILISLQTRQEQLSCFDMLAKNTGGWGPDFIGEQSKYSVILNGTSSSAGTPACVLFSAGHAQERSSPSKPSRSLFFSPSSASEATTVTSATKTDLQTVVSQSRRSSWSIF